MMMDLELRVLQSRLLMSLETLARRSLQPASQGLRRLETRIDFLLVHRHRLFYLNGINNPISL